MKANELMIGDLVIKSAGGDCKSTYKSNVSILELGDDEDFIPIPLTKDILEANGFERNWLEIDDNHNIQYDLSNNHIRMYSVVFGEYKLYFDMCILYVHELQHAMRLVGLHDLADNFKLSDSLNK